MLLVPYIGFEAHSQEQQPLPADGPAAEYGAIAFTGDGSFSSAWKRASKAEAEAKVRADCAAFGRGPCEIISFRSELCAAIASFQASGKKLTYAGGGLSAKIAQRSALERCNGDRRARGKCKLRTVVCGDGR